MENLKFTDNYLTMGALTMNTEEVALPYDIIVDIISRLPLKLIVACKFLSKALRDLISGPSFSQIYLSNKSNSFCTLNLDASQPDCSLYLAEFDQKGDHETVEIFNTERLPGGSSTSFKQFSICAYCNGLICLSKLEFGMYKCFVMNPILSEYIELPLPERDDDRTLFSYGLGHCQSSNRYKVLKFITVKLGDPSSWKTNNEIFTIGYDRIWRSVSDVSVPYNIESALNRPTMVPLRSALHWFVYHVSKPNRNHKIRICAFDMTEEKGSELQLPPGAMTVCRHNSFCHNCFCLCVSLDKLCLLKFWYFRVVDVWVMDEYGVEESWTKKVVLDMETLAYSYRYSRLIKLIVSPGDVIVISDCYKTFFYNTKKLTSIPFVPNFGSLRNVLPVSEEVRLLLIFMTNFNGR